MKNIITGITIVLLCSTAYGADMKQAPAVHEAERIIKKMGCNPWTGVMIQAKRGVKSELDDNAFVVPMFCNKEPQSIIAAQKSGKTYVSNEKFKLISTIKFDGRTVSGLATKHGSEAPVPYKIEAFK